MSGNTSGNLYRNMAQRSGQDSDVDLLELVFVLVRNWKSLLLFLLMGAVIGGAYHTCMVKPAYQASTDMYITSSDSVISLQDLQIGTAVASDYSDIIVSRQVLNQVISDLGLKTDYRGLKKLISITNPSGTHIIHTTVTTTNLSLSRDIANDLLQVSIRQIYQIVGTSRPTVIDYSEAAAVEDVTPGIVSSMAIGGFLGVALISVIWILKHTMNSTIKTEDDVERHLQLPTLAAVPYYKE